MGYSPSFCPALVTHPAPAPRHSSLRVTPLPSSNSGCFLPSLQWRDWLLTGSWVAPAHAAGRRPSVKCLHMNQLSPIPILRDPDCCFLTEGGTLPSTPHQLPELRVTLTKGRTLNRPSMCGGLSDHPRSLCAAPFPPPLWGCGCQGRTSHVLGSAGKAGSWNRVPGRGPGGPASPSSPSPHDRSGGYVSGERPGMGLKEWASMCLGA